MVICVLKISTRVIIKITRYKNAGYMPAARLIIWSCSNLVSSSIAASESLRRQILIECSVMSNCVMYGARFHEARVADNALVTV